MSVEFRKKKPETKEIFIGYNNFGVVMETVPKNEQIKKLDIDLLKPEKVEWSSIFNQTTDK